LRTSKYKGYIEVEKHFNRDWHEKT
jgi:hypothetical protein